MTWKQNLLQKAFLVSGVYIFMILPLWYHLPHRIYDFLIWPKYWIGLWINREIVFSNLDRLEQYITWDIWASTLMGTIAIIIIFVGRKDKDKFAYGKASYAKSRMFEKMGINYNSGFVLGKYKQRILYMQKPLSLLLLAPPGTGKTSGIVVPSVLSIKHSQVIHDPKGEIYDLTQQAKERDSQVLLFDATSANCAQYNPLCEDVLPLDEDSRNNYIRNLSKILISCKANDSNAFFYIEAQSVFVFFASWLIWDKGYTSFSEIRKKILSGNDLARIIYDMCPSLEPQDEEEQDEDIDESASELDEMEDDWKGGDDDSSDIPESIIELGRAVIHNMKNDRQWSAIISTLRQSLDVFESSTIANATSNGCDFTAQTLRSSPQTIYLRVKDIDKERLAPLITIIFSSLSSGLLSEMPREDSQQVSFILDEFVRLGRLDSIIDMPAVGRGYKFNAMFIAQDYGQITDLYSKEKLSAIESNTAYKIVLSQNNAETAKKISEQIGHTTRSKESQSVSVHTRDVINKGRSKNISKEASFLVSHQDIMNMEHGTGIVLAQNFFRHPIKITLPFYFKEPQFQRLTNA